MSNNPPGPWGPPPQGHNPWQQQPQGPNQWGHLPGGGGQGGMPPQPPRPRRDNLMAGLGVGVLAMVVGAALYAGVMKGTEHQVGYMAFGVAALIGFGVGKVGGANVLLPVFAAVLSLAAVFLGQFFGIALWASDEVNMSLMDVLNDLPVFDAWKESLEAMDFLFYAIAGFEGFVIAKRVGDAD